MEKIKVNNQIVLMRKYVKQAKVHVINKLVKQVKLLQNRKGNEAQMEKAKRKAERFLEEISLLKKIKPDHVSKLALSKASNWEDILKQKSSILEDRCIAMLANYAAVQKEVELFHNTNKDLVLKIPDLIKQWEEKNKYPKNLSKFNSKRISVNTGKKSKKEEKQITNGIFIKGKNEKDLQNDIALPSEGKMLNECKNESYEEIKVSIFSPKKIIPEICKHELDSNVDVTKTINHKKSDLSCQKNMIEAENDLERNALDIRTSDINKDLQNDDSLVKKITIIERSNVMKNSLETKLSGNKEDLEENKMDFIDSDTAEESEHDSKGKNYVTENQQELKNSETRDILNLEWSTSPQCIKRTHDAKNITEKIKVITPLNLDDLQSLDEIPVKSNEKKESDESEIESSENEVTETAQNKRNDPFFLRCGEEDPASDKKMIGFLKNKFLPEDKHSVFPYSQRESNISLEGKNKSNEFTNRKNSEKFSKNTHFSRGNNAKFQKDKFKPFQKDKFTARNYESKFQSRDRNNYPNQQDFKRNDKYLHNYRRKEHDDKSQYNRNNGNKFTEQHKKGNTHDKPLHPSWEAKKKQKELINMSFQGKRIVFND